jgi:hypothetical protein
MSYTQRFPNYNPPSPQRSKRRPTTMFDNKFKSYGNGLCELNGIRVDCQHFWDVNDRRLKYDRSLNNSDKNMLWLNNHAKELRNEKPRRNSPNKYSFYRDSNNHGWSSGRNNENELNEYDRSDEYQASRNSRMPRGQNLRNSLYEYNWSDDSEGYEYTNDQIKQNRRNNLNKHNWSDDSEGYD